MQIRNFLEAAEEAIAFGCEFYTGFVVVGFVFAVNLHIEFCKGIYIPYCHIFLHLRYCGLAGACEHAEAQTGDAIALGDRLHYRKVREAFENFIMQKRVVSETF